MSKIFLNCAPSKKRPSSSRLAPVVALFARNREVCLLILVGILAYLPAIMAAMSGGAPFRDDAISLFWPWHEFAREALRSGTLPLWNPYSQCGMPFLANIQTGVLYLPNLVYWFLPHTSAILIDAIAHNIALLLGAFFLARSLHIDGLPLSRSASFLAAIGIGLGSAVASHVTFGHVSWHASRAYIPWELWATLWFLRGGKMRHALLLAALFAAQIAAGYPPIAMLGIGLSCGLVFARSVSSFLASRASNSSSATSSTRSLNKLSSRGFASRCGLPRYFLRRTLVAALLCGALSAVYLLPMLEASGASVHGDKMDFSAVAYLSGNWAMLLRLLMLNYCGSNVSEWSVIERGAHEQTGFCGVVIFILSIAAPWIVRRPIARWLWAFLPISVALSLGNHTPLYQWLYDHFTLFQKLRVPARWIELWAFATPFLAALTFETVMMRRNHGDDQSENAQSDRTGAKSQSLKHSISLRHQKNVALAVLFGIFIVTVATILTPQNVWLNRIRWAQPTVAPTLSATTMAAAIDEFRMTALLACFMALTVAGFVVVFLSNKADLPKEQHDQSLAKENKSLLFRYSKQMHWAILSLALMELIVTFWQANASLSSAVIKDSNDFGGGLKNTYRADQRWQTAVTYYQANANLLHGIDNFSGYDALMSSRYFDFGSRVENITHWDAWFRFGGEGNSLLKVAGVTHLLKSFKDRRITPPANLVGREGKWSLWHFRQTWPRVYLTRQPEKVEDGRQIKRLLQLAEGDFERQHRPVVVSPDFVASLGVGALNAEDRVLAWSRQLNTTTIRCQAAEPSLLVQAEAFAPGWRAWVNGRTAHVEQTNYLFRGVVVPAGRSSVRMVYEPQTYRFASFITLLAIGALFFLAVAFFSRRQNEM